MSDNFSNSFFDNNFLVNDDIIEKIKNVQTPSIHIRPNWYTNLGQFYKDYIQPNIFAIVVIILLGIFLIIRYVIKKEKKKEKLKKSIKLAKKLREISNKEEQPKDDDNNYLDQYVDEILENNDEYFNDDEVEENNDVASLEKINKYFDDIEQSGLVSKEFLNDEKENQMKKLSFDELAKLVSGN